MSIISMLHVSTYLSVDCSADIGELEVTLDHG